MKWWKKFMCLFFESIKVVNGQGENLDLHEDRMNRTRLETLSLTEQIFLRPLIKTDINSLLKVRVIYREKVEKIEYLPYTPKRVDHLKIVSADNLQYNYKFLDRRCFEPLLSGTSPNSDILIVKNNRITDTSYSNIAFWDGARWLTPAEPLLKGTKRESLLRKGLLQSDDIRLDHLKLFKFARLINAMIDLDSSPVIEIANIH
jgi:4-amino-4-deoxychorismate lyase